MSFSFVPGNYYHSMWYVDLPALPGAEEGCTHGGNMTALLWRENDSTQWTYQYRFRYYRPDGHDEFVWYEMTMPDQPVEKLADGVRQMFQMLYEKAKEVAPVNEPSKLMIEGDNDAFFAAVERDKPHWLNLKTEDASVVNN